MIRFTLNADDGRTFGEPGSCSGPEDLARLLVSRGPRVMGWIALAVLEEHSRAKGKKCLARTGTAYDLDYRAEQHAHDEECSTDCDRDFDKAPKGLPSEVWAKFKADCEAGKFSDLIQVAYSTPNGIRGIGLYQEEVIDPRLWRPIAVGAIQRMKDRLKELGYPEPPYGLQVDEQVTGDVKRLLYLPDAFVDGVQRRGQIGSFSEVLLDPYAFIPPDWKDEPDSEEKGYNVTFLPPTAAQVKFRESRDAYVARNGRSYQRALGSCPSGHAGSACFHRHPEKDSLWVCFSSHHREGCGRRQIAEGVTPCFFGDALDLDAYAQSRTPGEHLRATGYLTDPVSEEAYASWRKQAEAKAALTKLMALAQLGKFK